MDHIRFAPIDPPKPKSLFETLDFGGNIRWRQMTACKLTYELNDPEPIEVFVAAKRRYAIDEIEDDQPFVIANLQGAF